MYQGWCICKYKFAHGNGLCEFSEAVRKVRSCHALDQPKPVTILKACPMRYDRKEVDNAENT